MTPIEIATLVLQAGIPLVLIARVGLRRGTAASWWIDIVLTASYLTLIGVAGLWLALPRRASLLILSSLFAAAIVGAGRVRTTATGSPSPVSKVWLGLRAALVLACLVATSLALSGRRRFDSPPVDVRFPLQDGAYFVANGGSRAIVNFHLETLTRPEARPYRGQSYAVDLVEVGGWGSRLSSLSPDDLTEYAIFGDAIHAPCDGEVVGALDGQPDQALGESPLTLPGNYVILECDGAWVFLGHMMQGSVAVRRGETVGLGEPLGRVGNSGASGEPHLHVHAQRPGTEEEPLSGDPLPITFDGRHLVRNERIDGGS